LGRDLSESQTLETDKLSYSADDDFVIEASLTFALDKLVFHRNEVSIARERRALIEARVTLVHAIVQLYFERRRLQLERDLSSQPEVARTIRIVEIEALLNAFTQGEFERMIASQQSN
jgi:hypothetical protein